MANLLLRDVYRPRAVAALESSAPDTYVPEQQREEPGLEAPMFSPDDLIGSGLLKAGAASAAGLYAMMKMAGKGGPKMFPGQAGAIKGVVGKTQYELAHELAQRNAALPVSQGGLGLPAGNTAMDRAEAMGFGANGYHGTASSEDFTKFSNLFLGATTGAESAKMAHFLSGKPQTAETYLQPSAKQLVDSGVLPESAIDKLGKPSMVMNLSDIMTHRPPPEISEMERRLILRAEERSKSLVGELKAAGKAAASGDLFLTKKQLADFNSRNGTSVVGKQVEHAPDFYEVGRKEVGDLYLNSVKNQEMINAIELAAEIGGKPRVMPLMINSSGMKKVDFKGSGFRPESYAAVLSKNPGGAVILNTRDGGPLDTIYAVTDPANIRSRFAAFDPLKRNSADVLAGAGAAGFALDYFLGGEESD